MARGSNTNNTAAGSRPATTSSASSSSVSMEDSSSPYFLSSGDHPGLTLVSHVLLGSNFHSWSRAMMIALSPKNKLFFVDGSLPRPVSDDLLFQSWNRCNSMVTSWILNSVSKDISDSLLYFSSASEIWTDLRNRFLQANGPKIFQLKQQIASLTQGSLDVNGYYTRLKILWDEFQDYSPIPACTCGASRLISASHQQDHALQFLMGLNDSFSSVRAQILLMEPLPQLSRIFSLVLQEEKQRQITCPLPVLPDSPLLNSASAVASSPIPGSAPMAAISSAPFRRSRPQCTYCHNSGHTREKCFKLHGFPPGYKPKFVRPNPLTPSAHAIFNSPNPTIAELPNPTLTPSQYNHLLSLLPPTVPSSSSPSFTPLPLATEASPSVASFSGPFIGQSDWDC
ncbi:uncharacterized protein LOC133296862 [Gastrolobium bilobum]|uniref:uncharacterized protein LOC133296862 n=1 Tax=Gastrolobium bilobum TaxID=150636 RepID=UPI002AAF6F3E|nr:uncharacterized protein LOC133296862 [Gastrolobium bilobum]